MISLSGLAINNSCTVVCISHSAAGFLFTAGIGRPSAIAALLCTVRDRPSAVSRYTQSGWTWILCMTARLDVTPKTTKQNRIVRTGKSEAEVTSNKKLRFRYCTIEANYWQTRSIARSLCDSRATCSLRYSNLSIFKMAANRHLGFWKFAVFVTWPLSACRSAS